jgi:hypothetical protein
MHERLLRHAERAAVSAALTTPELVSPATTRSIAASIAPGRRSSQMSLFLRAVAIEPALVLMAGRAMRSPVKRGNRPFAAPGMMPLRAGRQEGVAPRA